MGFRLLLCGGLFYCFSRVAGSGSVVEVPSLPRCLCLVWCCAVLCAVCWTKNLEKDFWREEEKTQNLT